MIAARQTAWKSDWPKANVKDWCLRIKSTAGNQSLKISLLIQRPTEELEFELPRVFCSVGESADWNELPYAEYDSHGKLQYSGEPVDVAPGEYAYLIAQPKGNGPFRQSGYAAFARLNISGGAFIAEHQLASLTSARRENAAAYIPRQLAGVFTLTQIADAANLVLPRTLNTADSAFYVMFDACSKLTAFPELPEGDLAPNSCRSMFAEMTQPSIPRDFKLAGKTPRTFMPYACYSMFRAGVGLSVVPNTLFEGFGRHSGQQLCAHCFFCMFQSSAKLAEVEQGLQLPEAVAPGLFKMMFDNCESLSSVPADMIPHTQLLSQDQQLSQCNGMFADMFSACTHLSAAPEIRLSALPEANWKSDTAPLARMFANCSSLASVHVEFTNWG